SPAQARFRPQEIRARARPDQRTRFRDQQGGVDPGRGGGIGAVLRRDGSGRRLAQRLRPERAPWTFASRQIRKAPATRSSRDFSAAWKIAAMSGYGARSLLDQAEKGGKADRALTRRPCSGFSDRRP